MNRSSTLAMKCFVPFCKNTTTKNRNKVFVFVRESLKKKWCELVKIPYSHGRHMYCCEDHLNLDEDLENFEDWKVTKKRPKLKRTAKLRIQNENQLNLPSCSKNIESNTYQDNTPIGSNILKNLLQLPTQTLAVKQTNIQEINRPSLISAYTHPTKVDAAVQCSVEMKTKGTTTKGLILSAKVLSSTSDDSLSVYTCPSDTASSEIITQTDYSLRQQTLKLIYNDTKTYIGLPKQYIWLINHIISVSTPKITELDIIMTLNKIKLNNPVNVLCDQFQVSNATFCKSFYSGIQALANFFQNLIYLPPLLEIKRNQPLAFKIRYSNVQLLLDAFEIEIQKPGNPKTQAQTWSQYKNANTIKYLIGSTPNGLVSFVSEGYGGRISDKALVKMSNLIESLPDNAIIMTDRGFKEIEADLAPKRIKLLRPPSVFASTKPTKEEVLQTKIIASLRVHIERVIRRLREFRFLKPHSVVSHKHVVYLDHTVVIACGLINLQGELIKTD